MKKILFLLLIVAFAIQVNAQTAEKNWGVGAGAGAYGTLKNGGIGIIPEFYISRYLSPKFDLMYQNNIALFNSNIKGTDFDFAVPAMFNLRYKLMDETKKLRPFLFAGPGLFVSNLYTKAGFTFDLGVGAKYYFNQKWAGYLEAGYLKGIEETVNGKSLTDNYWKVTTGLEVDFGKVKDSDMDGVSDKKDKCPNTPAGVAVDANGCPVDSDGDGVADYLDDCPTVAGLTSLKGCPDSDNDGVADKNDKCPNTPKGVKVDASGCALDTDKDGIPDYLDNCPTVAGTKENKGCPVKEAVKEPVKEVEKPKVITKDQVELQDIKVEPIRFESGKSNVTKTAKVLLDKMVKTLNQNKDFNVNVYGYADSRGTEDLNMKLSQKRLDAAIQYLESKGISKTRIIKHEAFGASKPAASNDTEEGRLQNRRVEFEIFKMK